MFCPSVLYGVYYIRQTTIYDDIPVQHRISRPEINSSHIALSSQGCSGRMSVNTRDLLSALTIAYQPGCKGHQSTPCRHFDFEVRNRMFKINRAKIEKNVIKSKTYRKPLSQLTAKLGEPSKVGTFPRLGFPLEGT